MWGRLVRAAPAILVAGAILGAFWDKAFTIDDPFFLRQAQQVIEDPLHPYAFEFTWMNRTFPAARSAVSGPGMAYLLAPTVRIGGAEWAAHLTVFALLMLAAGAIVSLAERLDFTPAESTLTAMLLVTSPAVLVMSSTSMPDVPAMALGLWGIERCVAFRDRNGWHRGLAAATLLVAAALFRSHFVVLLGVGALLLLGDTISGDRRAPALARLWPLALAGVAILALGLLLLAPTGGRDTLSALQFSASLSHVPDNTVAYFAHLVFALPLTLPWALLRWREISKTAFVAAGVGTASYLWWFDLLAWWWAIPMVALAFSVVCDVTWDAWKCRGSLRLTLAAWLLAALPTVVYHQLPAKFMLVSAPAVSLLLVGVARESGVRARRSLWVVAAGSAVLALLIIRADDELAELGRRAARELVAPQVAAGRTVWYTGDWGFHWYAERAGARPLVWDSPAAEPGDVVVAKTMYHDLHGLTERYELKPVDRVLHYGGPGGRIMSLSAGAGFYSNKWGLLPWSWGSEPVDRFDLYRVVRRIDAEAGD